MVTRLAPHSIIAQTQGESNSRTRRRQPPGGEVWLSTAELMAAILGTGTAEENVLRLSQRLLHDDNGLAGLAQAPIADLTRRLS